MHEMKSRLIVALDVPNASAARQTVERLGSTVNLFKVGLELFSGEGPAIVRDLSNSGREVFLDLKLHDIPHTVGRAVDQLAPLGATMLTVHAGGGGKMLRAAVEAAKGRVAIVAVTALTSMSDEDLHEVGVPACVADHVVRLALLAREAGCQGVVASPREIAVLRKSVGNELRIVTPGIRPSGAAKNDQERTATPGEAVRAGADYLVIGRPITQADDPAAAAAAIVQEMDHVEALSR